MRSILRLSRHVLDALAPERCAACDATVAADVLFCHACREAVNVLSPHTVRVAGLGGAIGSAGVAIASLTAFARYDAGADRGPVAAALQAFKYRNAFRLAPRLAAAMAACAPAGTEPPLVAPVPLHVRRLRGRGFNQSALLARHVGRLRGWPVAVDLLVRVRDTPSQTALDVVARRTNVAGAFAVRRAEAARKRHVLLVDDVWTSGATAQAIAELLRDAGVAAVDVLTFARVV